MLGILEQFGTECYTWRLDVVQNLCEFCQFFLSDFLVTKCAITPSCILLMSKGEAGRNQSKISFNVERKASDKIIPRSNKRAKEEVDL